MEARAAIFGLLLLMHLILGFANVLFFCSMAPGFKTPLVHSLLNLTALTLMALGISMFRFLQGVNTRVVKYIHMCWTVLILAIILIAVIPYMTDPSVKQIQYNHAIPGYTFLIFYSLQLVVAMVFFVLLFPTGRLRNIVAPFHNIVGIWLYYCFVGVAISGWHKCKIVEKEGYEYPDCNQELNSFRNILIFNALFVHVWMLHPYFQWEMMGPL